MAEIPFDVPRCDARIRPFPHELELMCTREFHNGSDTRHESVVADYAYPGSRTVLTWFESDRRNFRGEWIECPERACGLPCGHRGDHA